MDTLQVKQKQLELDRTMAIFCPKCRKKHPKMECKDQSTRAPDTEYDDVLVECSSSQSNHRRGDSLHSVLCSARSVVLCAHSKCHEQCDSSV